MRARASASTGTPNAVNAGATCAQLCMRASAEVLFLKVSTLGAPLPPSSASKSANACGEANQ
jgi:hypothetical protein